MKFPIFAKKIIKKIFLSKASPNNATLAIYKRFDKQWLSERSFYYGDKLLRATCLTMESAPGTAEVIIRVLQESGAGQGARVLDFGCGQHKSQYLKAMGFNVHSCDILDFEMENFTKIDPLTHKLPFNDGQFDIVVASEVLEHVESPWEVLLELLRVCKKTVVFSTPNPASLKSRKQFFKRGFLYWFAPENFTYHISPVFWWQVELFCQRHSLKHLTKLSNHNAFLLNDADNSVERAEAFIYKLDL